jgi:hypothetical protein
VRHRQRMTYAVCREGYLFKKLFLFSSIGRIFSFSIICLAFPIESKVNRPKSKIMVETDSRRGAGAIKTFR